MLMATRLLPGVRCLLTLVVLSLPAAACGRAAPAAPTPGALPPSPRLNLLHNGDFEGGLAMWKPAPGAVPLTLDPAGFVTSTPGTGPKRAALCQAVPVQAGAAYCVSYRVRVEGLLGCAGLTLTFRDGAGRTLEELGLLGASGDSDWTTRAWRCRAPAGATEVLLSVGVAEASVGVAAFDDLCFAPDDAPLTRALIVDWREESGALPALAGRSPGDVAGLAVALPHDGDGPPACPGVGLPLSGPAGALLAQLSQTPRRLSTQGGDDLGFALLAGRSDDGRLAHILIADAGSRSEAYRLSLAAFPPGFCYTVTEAAAEAPPRVVQSGDGAALNGLLMSSWRSPAVQLIRIWWQ